ncbi:hypothetical protein INR49_031160, partial [Caranx melampygus]
MAFASLFTRLSAVEEDVKSPGQGAVALSNGRGMVREAMPGRGKRGVSRLDPSGRVVIKARHTGPVILHLWMADECQLEHIEGYNDMIKEACKFYIQGFCTKGESCPYMHNILCRTVFSLQVLPYKRKCSQGTECKFSHDPLNEVTKQLMDELLKREKDLQELTKKAEEEAQGQPADTEQNLSPDTLIQALRPSFYNSGEVNTEQEASSCQTEQLSAVIETAVSHQASDSGPPHSPLSTNLTHKEPIHLQRRLSSRLTSQFQRTRSVSQCKLGSEESLSEPEPIPTGGRAAGQYAVQCIFRSVGYSSLLLEKHTQSSDQQFPDKTVPDSTGSQPSSQTPLTSVQATGRSSCRNPGTPGPQGAPTATSRSPSPFRSARLDMVVPNLPIDGTVTFIMESSTDEEGTRSPRESTRMYVESDL